MAKQVPQCEPRELYIGSSWAWDVTYPDFPSDDGWTLAYEVQGAKNLPLRSGTEVTAASSGSGFEIRVPRATTAKITAGGGYDLIGRVFKAGDKWDGEPVYRGHLQLHANPDIPIDTKSVDRRRLEALEAAIVTQGSEGLLYQSIEEDGTKVVYRQDQYDQLLGNLRTRVATEENPTGRVLHAAEFVRG